MKIKTWIKYEESYIPPRCRKVRYKECEEYVDVDLREVKKDDLRIAFEDCSFQGKGEIYMYKKKLWCKAGSGCFIYRPEDFGAKTPLDELIYRNLHSSRYFPCLWQHPDRDRMIKAAKSDMKSLLLVDGELFQQTNEPRYVVNTFGFGNNHGGTGLFVEYSCNQNIRKECYFSALDGKEAVEYANRTAEGRGDTNDVGRFHEMIKVYMPEIVRFKARRNARKSKEA